MDKEGRVLTVRKYLDGLKLCAVDLQQGNWNSHKGIILNRTPNQMALQFEYESISYSPKVDNGKLTLVGNPGDLTDSHWFRRTNQGANEYCCLQSVADPGYYLSIHTLESNEVILSNHPQHCLLVTNLFNN